MSLFPLLFSEKEVERTLLSPLLSRPEVVAFFDGSHPSLHSPIPHPPSPTLGKGENRVAKEEQANLRRLSYLHRVSHKVIQQRILCILIVCFYRHPVFINQELDTTVAAAASRVLGRVARIFLYQALPFPSYLEFLLFKNIRGKFCVNFPSRRERTLSICLWLWISKLPAPLPRW